MSCIIPVAMQPETAELLRIVHSLALQGTFDGSAHGVRATLGNGADARLNSVLPLVAGPLTQHYRSAAAFPLARLRRSRGS